MGVRSITEEQFILRSNQIHNNKYDYCNMNFTGMKNSVSLTCQLHGPFSQRAYHHAKGRGCPQCGKRSTITIFINRSKMVHGNRYNYDKVKYITNRIPVEIICSVHGSFFPTPYAHMKGHGCGKCNTVGRYSEEFFQNHPSFSNEKAILYVVEFSNETEKFFKLGVTKKSLTKRFEKNKAYLIVPQYTMTGSLLDLYRLEQIILKQFVYMNRYTPSIKIGGDRECFVHSRSLLDSIIQELDRLAPQSLCSV